MVQWKLLIREKRKVILINFITCYVRTATDRSPRDRTWQLLWQKQYINLEIVIFLKSELFSYLQTILSCSNVYFHLFSILPILGQVLVIFNFCFHYLCYSYLISGSKDVMEWTLSTWHLSGTMAQGLYMLLHGILNTLLSEVEGTWITSPMSQRLYWYRTKSYVLFCILLLPET